jgi:hypothetical protein
MVHCLKLGYARGSSILPLKCLVRNSQEYLDFFRFSRGCRRQRVEVFEETSSRKTDRAKVPFDNFYSENYFGDADLRNTATRCASPVKAAQSVEDALRGDLNSRLEHRHTTLPDIFPNMHSSLCWTMPRNNSELVSMRSFARVMPTVLFRCTSLLLQTEAHSLAFLSRQRHLSYFVVSLGIGLDCMRMK